jgi:cyclopropane-fatty-acyl-phospholipid synthase
MVVRAEIGESGSRRLSAPRDERLFFDFVGPALREDVVQFLCDDRVYRFGSVGQPTIVRIHGADFFRDVLARGNLGLGESFMNGEFEIVQGTLESFLIALARADIERFVRQKPLNAVRLLPIFLRNLVRGRYRNVQSHYDLGEDLFESFLDDAMAYSCGYALSENDTLDALQTQKFDRICRKLRLEPGDRVLDIGCGFGGLLIHAARQYGARCTGVTIAHHHHRRAQANAEAKGVSDLVEIRFASHRDLGGPYDKIVSVGMFEHLTRRDYPVFFSNVKRALVKDGIGLLHTVGFSGYRNGHDPFIQKYMLPGSRTPKLSELADQLEHQEMPIIDVENIASHYTPTLRHWRNNFLENYHHLDHVKYDETFKRMFEYYITCCIAASVASEATVFQVLFKNNFRIDMPFQRV